MSRNTEHQFISTDTGELVALLTAIYERITKTTVQPASPERLFIQYMANIIVQERVLTNYTGNQNVPSRSEGENLDALAELTHIHARPEAKAATCKVKFSISEAQETAILIRAGTRVTDPGNTLIWETESDAYSGGRWDLRQLCEGRRRLRPRAVDFLEPEARAPGVRQGRREIHWRSRDPAGLPHEGALRQLWPGAVPPQDGGDRQGRL